MAAANMDGGGGGLVLGLGNGGNNYISGNRVSSNNKYLTFEIFNNWTNCYGLQYDIIILLYLRWWRKI